MATRLQTHGIAARRDRETCVARVSSRTGHDFRDEDAARKMHEEFARASVPARHVLTLESESVGEVVDRIAEARAAGALQVRPDARDQPPI